MRVSAHSRLPKSSGEFVAQARTGPASSWAMLYMLANSSALDLQVNLEAGVARLDHHRVVAHTKLVDPLDVQLEASPRRLRDGVVERQVARVLHHVVEREVALAHRRQDAGEHDVEAGGRGDGADDGRGARRAGPPSSKHVAAEDLRVEVDLEVERADLGREVPVGDVGEDRQRPRRRLPRAVDEEHLLLGPDAAHAGLEHVARRACARARAGRAASIGSRSGGRSCSWPFDGPCALLHCATALLDRNATPRRRGTAAASLARSASRAATAAPTSRPGWGCLRCRARGPRATTRRCPRSRLRPVARMTNRVRRSSRCGPSRLGRKCSGERAKKSSPTGPSVEAGCRS